MHCYKATVNVEWSEIITVQSKGHVFTNDDQNCFQFQEMLIHQNTFLLLFDHSVALLYISEACFPPLFCLSGQ